jgi:hypothetical protein
MASANGSRPISKVFKLIIYFSTNVASYQTNKKSWILEFLYTFSMFYSNFNVLINILTNLK